MKKLIVSLTVIIMVAAGECVADSQILGAIQKLLPTTSELGFLTNIVNCYFQVSQFIRSTEKLVNNIRAARAELYTTQKDFENLWQDVKDMGNGFDPYNMDTWQTPIYNASRILDNDMWDIGRHFSMLEDYSIYAAGNYVIQVTSEKDYQQFYDDAKRGINLLYVRKATDSANQNMADEISIYKQNTITSLSLTQQGFLSQYPDTSKMPADVKAQYISVSNELQTLRDMTDYHNRTANVDSMIEECSDLITVNLTEISASETRIKQMEVVAGQLAQGFYNFTGGSVGTNPAHQGAAGLDSVGKSSLDSSLFSSSDPNKVPTPTDVYQTINQTNSTDKKASVNEQDVVALQNAAKLLLLKQECLERDIGSMKVNTMAFLLAIEANELYESEKATVAGAVNANVMNKKLYKRSSL